MENGDTIGIQAMILDGEMTALERMKISKETVKKLLISLVAYVGILGLMGIFL